MNLNLIALAFALGFLISLGASGAESSDTKDREIAVLTKMVHDREAAMKVKDLASVMAQFADDATFINSAGYYCANKSEVELFHKNLVLRDDVGYNYLAGKVTVRLIDDKNALVYYPWQMDWFKVATPKEFTKEVGLMTLSAQKRSGKWMWIAITNQHTREFFEDLTTNKPPSFRAGTKKG
jgi:hypothetical protein